MTIYCFAGGKGGSGKSTASRNVAVELVHRGRRVALLDGDPQGSTLTWDTVRAEGGHTASGMFVAGSGANVASQVAELASDYDDVVIDCPGRLGAVQRAAYMVADVVILPCQPTPDDIWALSESVELVQQAQTLRPELLAVVMVSRKVPNTTLGREIRSVLTETGLPVLSAVVGQRTAYPSAGAEGRGVTEYQPSGPAASEIRDLVDELAERAGNRRAAA